jgi:hypothetical protein
LDEAQVGWGVSEVQAAFVTNLTALRIELRLLVSLENGTALSDLAEIEPELAK